MKWLVHWLEGFLLVTIQGTAPERFLNLCRGREIEVWRLKAGPEGCEGYISVKGFRDSRELLKKSGARLKIRKRFGLPFFLYRNRKRKFFFGGIAAAAVLLYVLTFFVWDIQIEGNQRYSDDSMIHYFEDQGIFCGMMKKNVDCDELESSIRSDFPEIIWVSARVSGTRLFVSVKENEALSSIPVPDTEPQDIVAEKDGVVTSMIVRSGVPQVSIGDTVTSGQVLISGLVPITDDGGNVTAVHGVRADGDITARVAVSEERSYSGLKTVEMAAGKERKGLFLKAGGIAVQILLPAEKGTSWKISMEEQQLHLTDHFYLPFWWGTIRAKEYVTYERLYTAEEKEMLRKKMEQEFAEKIMEKGVQIEQNNVKILENDQGFSIRWEAVVLESIGAGRPIEEIPVIEENEEN